MVVGFCNQWKNRKWTWKCGTKRTVKLHHRLKLVLSGRYVSSNSNDHYHKSATLNGERSEPSQNIGWHFFLLRLRLKMRLQHLIWHCARLLLTHKSKPETSFIHLSAGSTLIWLMRRKLNNLCAHCGPQIGAFALISVQRTLTLIALWDTKIAIATLRFFHQVCTHSAGHMWFGSM